MTGPLPAYGPVEDLVRLRESLHQEPEVGLDLPRTKAKVLAALDGLDLEITTGSALSSVTAVLRGRDGGTADGPPPVVLLRADMDALPLTETTGVPYASAHEGRMHACGHDLHTAMLVGAARQLAAQRDDLAGDVILMFQPGEEGHHGARLMIEEGVLDAAGPGRRPVAAYALHVASSLLPTGAVLTRKGPLLAGGDALRVTVRGRGGHDSQPHLLRDPVPAACEMVLALQTYASRGFDPFDPVLLSVGSIHAGTAANIVPDEAELKIGVRTFGPGAKAQVLSGVTRVLEGVAAAHGVTVEVDHAMDYPVTVVDPAEADFAAAVVDRTLGPGRLVWSPIPLSPSEDFSFVLDQVPGAMLFLGACPPDRDPAKASFNHSPDAVFGNEVLGDGARLLAGLAADRLAAAAGRAPA
ncbi:MULTISPECIES: M20 metallopeptidase family protein [unclassified Streptomyces]|uniref:M20 metallopeptidase family protein n=1 Tax=unclassified Streptomyces TaxID=2593676 RepID=UPI0009397083|nr:M20 family metallopeptidase [Streptomyces sp. CB02058]OKI94627.1 amidohydrolase [Streptomyces sp. CB02058]